MSSEDENIKFWVVLKLKGLLESKGFKLWGVGKILLLRFNMDKLAIDGTGTTVREVIWGSIYTAAVMVFLPVDLEISCFGSKSWTNTNIDS